MYPSGSSPKDQYRKRGVVPPAVTEQTTSEEALSSPPLADLNAGSDRSRWTPRMERSGFNNDRIASAGPSVGRRMFRTVSRFFVAVLIGVGVTLGWQSYGGEAKEMIRTRAPWLGWLLPGPKATLPAAAGNSPEMVRQLEPMARDLAAVRRSVEELAGKQEQVAQYVERLRAVEQDIMQKMSLSPPKIPQPAAPAPAARPSSLSR